MVKIEGIQQASSFKQSSKNCQRIIRQLSVSVLAVVKKMSDCREVMIFVTVNLDLLHTIIHNPIGFFHFQTTIVAFDNKKNCNYQ